MAAGGEDKGRDFYAVLGLKKECTAAELRYAYRKLAMRWHPDRCSASGNSNFVEEAKKKFQVIQEAYSVLSDANKRFLYDVGVYDNDDDDENGMADFLNEMADMMCQAKSSEIREDSFEELQDLFEEMFQGEMDAFRCTSHTSSTATCSTTSSSPYQAYGESSNSSHKRNSSEMNSAKTKVEDSAAGFNNAHFQSFCIGVEQNRDSRQGKGIGGVAGGATGRRRSGRKQKVSLGHDISSNDYSRFSGMAA